MEAMEKTLRVRMNTDTIKTLTGQAEEGGVTLSWLVRKVLTDYSKREYLHIPLIGFTGKGDEIGGTK